MAVNADYDVNTVYQKVENISSQQVCAMMCTQLMDTKNRVRSHSIIALQIKFKIAIEPFVYK
jgi:hypothetical protein